MGAMTSNISGGRASNRIETERSKMTVKVLSRANASHFTASFSVISTTSLHANARSSAAKREWLEEGCGLFSPIC